MPRQLPMPTDQHSAMEVMKYFPDMAYVAPYKDTFDRATKILYGEDVAVTLDLSKRMTFSCLLCSKEMNGETALKQHTQSGSHQKNLDKKSRERHGHSYHKDVKYHHRDPYYGDPKGLRAMLTTSQVKPVGLQMIEEYEKASGGQVYYKCILCGAHGKLESIYRHIIGNRHTEKYIKSGVVLVNAMLTSKEREVIREYLLEKEGITVSSIKTYRDRRLYPHQWEHYSASLRFVGKKKREAQWEEHSPTPSTSRRHRRSPSPDVSLIDSPSSSSSSRKKHRDPSPLSKFRNQSPPNTSAEKKPKPTSLQLAPQNIDIVKQDQSAQKYDLEELMIQFNFIVKTSHLPECEIRSTDDVKAAIDMMFKISNALYTIIKSRLERPQDTSKEAIEILTQKKSLLSRIMGNIKLRMEAALLQREGLRPATS